LQTSIQKTSGEKPRFLTTNPFERSKDYARKHQCDLAIPNHIGLGSLVCYTPLVEAMARKLGRPLRLLHGPHSPSYGANPNEETPYSLWENNPYIGEIVNGMDISPEMMQEISDEMDNFCQFGHVIENICTPYGLKPRNLHGSLFLNSTEMKNAITTLSKLPRPLICLCPYGRSASTEDSPWFFDNWVRLIEECSPTVGFFQTGNCRLYEKDLPVYSPQTTVRESIALMWAADAFIGFDTGPTHIATALQKPSLVLWDALRKMPLEDKKQPGFGISHMTRWSYPQNKNLIILHERHDEIFHLTKEFIMETSTRPTCNYYSS
jgi:hypothetical protein